MGGYLMNLLQVRKGQFVYYKNELHKVYSVRPLSRLPVLMYRIKDMEQVTSRAENIIYYKPKHMDCLMLLGVAYTLRKDEKALVGGYILITNPNPGALDHYSLNEFEKVDRFEGAGVLTTLNNTVKPKEFLVLLPGEQADSNPIDYLDRSLVTDTQIEEDRQLQAESQKEIAVNPSVGDIYMNLDNGIKTMIVAVIDDEVVLGHGERMKADMLVSSDSWHLIYLTEEDHF